MARILLQCISERAWEIWDNTRGCRPLFCYLGKWYVIEKYETIPEDVGHWFVTWVSIHVILAWNEIGRSAIFGREIEVPDREVFSRQKKKSILVAKIISSTVDHCKMFYLPLYGIVKQYCPLFCSFLVIVRGWVSEGINWWVDRWVARWVSDQVR